jgi:hypothetical protein
VSCQVVLEDATVTLKMAPMNVVSDLVVVAGALPPPDTPAGSAVRLQVEVATEDQRPLTAEAAASGLLLRLTPPGKRQTETRPRQADGRRPWGAAVLKRACAHLEKGLGFRRWRG